MTVDADALLPHAKRGALVLVASSLDVLDVAVAVAMNRSAAVAYWLSAGLLTKVGEAAYTQLHSPSTPLSATANYRFVIVQPYVIAQLLVD
jgi:hypothetical protein